MTDTIPALERILALPTYTGSLAPTRGEGIMNGLSSRTVDPARSSNGEDRFKYVFGMFIRAVASHKPLILFLDDLQWADETALALLRSLIMDGSAARILFVLTYRDEAGADDDDPERLLTLFSDLSENEATNRTEMRLSNLNKEEVHTMLCELFGVTSDLADPLTNLVWEQSKGNIFFILEYLRLLHKDDIIRRVDNDQWNWEGEEIRLEEKKYTSTDNLIVAQISELSEQDRENLKIASCLGSRLDTEILGHLMANPLSSCFLEASKKGLLVFDQISNAWKFSHDLIQETVFQSIPVDEREGYHYRIGRKLWRTLDMDEIDHFIFIVVGQLVLALSLMTDSKERIAVAKLCLHAGKRAAELSNFHTARIYIMHGISFLGTRSWRDDYDLCISLYNAAAEVSYAAGHVDLVHELVQEVLLNARCFDDTIRAQTMSVFSYGSNGEPKKATQTSIRLLKSLGEIFPARPTPLHVLLQMRRISKRLNGKTTESILRLPEMCDPRKIAAMQILNLSYIYAIMTSRDLAALLAFRIVSLTLDYGINDVSCLGFGVLATVLW